MPTIRKVDRVPWRAGCLVFDTGATLCPTWDKSLAELALQVADCIHNMMEDGHARTASARRDH